MTSPIRPADRSRYLWWGGLALVVLIGIVALIATNGTSDGTSEKQTEDVVAQQTAPVSLDAPEAVTLPPFNGQGEDPAIGQVIPTVSGTSLEGRPMTISPDGKAKVMLFVAHWCPHCQREIPRLVEHLKNNPMPDDVELVTVSTSVAEDRGNYPPSAWLENAGWPVPVLADSEEQTAAQTYGLSSFPYYVVVDAEGKVVTRTSGELTDPEFDRLVDAAEAGRLAT